MEYGLRRYEMSQRLLWFLFFLLCVAVSFPAVASYLAGHPPLEPAAAKELTARQTAFWLQQQWIREGFLPRIILHGVAVALLFLLGRLAWLFVQYVGAFAVRGFLSEAARGAQAGAMAAGEAPDGAALAREAASERAIERIRKTPLRFFFHAYRRLHILLSGPQKVLSAEELLTRESRLVEADWQIASGAWEPYRWVVRVLPLVGLAATLVIFYGKLQPVLEGKKDIQEAVAFGLASLLPFVQVSVAAVGLHVAGSLLRKVEGLYLATVDSLFYDQLLARLPLRSPDTVLILNALRAHVEELREALHRIERAVTTGGKTP